MTSNSRGMHALLVVAELTERSGCRLFNALYGNRQPGVASDVQDRPAGRSADPFGWLEGVARRCPVAEGSSR